jgi:hypothetical protein
VANTLDTFRNGASLLANAFGVGFIDWLGGGRGIIMRCHWPSMEDKNLTVDLGLVEILPALRWLRISSDEHRLFESRDTPILIRNSVACVRLGFFSCSAINPAVDERATSFRGFLRTRLELKIKYWHSSGDTV